MLRIWLIRRANHRWAWQIRTLQNQIVATSREGYSDPGEATVVARRVYPFI